MTAKDSIVKAKQSSQVNPSFDKPRRAWGYIHLQRKQAVSMREFLTVDEEWQQLTSTISSTEADYNCYVATNIAGFSLSCIKHEKISFHGQRCITEITISKLGDRSKKIEVKAKSHTKCIDITDIEAKTADFPIQKKARFIISLLSTSPLCMGFEDNDMKNVNFQHNRYLVKNL